MNNKKSVLVFAFSLVFIVVFLAQFIDAYVVEESETILDISEENYRFISINNNEVYAIDGLNSKTQEEFASGYIIEFKETPLFVAQSELDKKIKQLKQDKTDLDKQKRTKKDDSKKASLQKEIEKKEKEKKIKVNEQKEKLEKEHENALADFGKYLNEEPAMSPEEGNFFDNVISFFSELFEEDKKISYSPKENEKEFYNIFNGIYLNITSEQAEEIKSSPYVKSVSPNMKVEATLMDSVPQIQDGILAGQLDREGNDCIQTGKECLTGKGITIGIIDTGVDYTHADLGRCTSEQFLSGTCSKVVGGYDFVNNDNDPIDDQGHGTHCAGIAAGNGVLKGVAPDAKLYAYKVLSSSGSGSSEGVIAGIERAVSDGADVLSLSLGGPGNPDDPTSTAIDNAVNSGVVAVIAAGNSGPSEKTIGSPGTARKAITIGAVDKSNNIASFSSRGPVIWENEFGREILVKPDVVAPGVNICAAEWDSAWNDKKCFDQNHVAISGTSMATPHVAGVVALIKQAHPDWTPGEIKSTLKGTAEDLGLSLFEQGAGKIDVKEAIKLATPLEMPWDFYAFADSLVGNIFEINRINGIFPEEYSSLVVEWKKEGDVSWKNEGIKIIGVNGVVAEFNPEGNILETGDYEFRVILNKDNFEKEQLVIIYFDISLKQGWPKKIPCFIESGGWVTRYTPTIADLNGDEKKEIILHTLCQENVFDGDGKSLAGWPTSLSSSIPYLTGSVIPGASINDIDNDRDKELISFLSGSSCFNVYEKDGTFKGSWGWPHECSTNTIQIAITPPVVVDLNRDGFLEIIAYSSGGGGYSKLIVLDKDGNIFENWPYTFEGRYNNLYLVDTFSTADLDKDGFKEIVLMDYKIVEINGIVKSHAYLFIFEYNGFLKEGYPIRLPDFDVDSINRYSKGFIGGPNLVDINNDNLLEIGIIRAGGNCYSNNGLLTFINLDGSVVEGYPINFDDKFDSLLSYADLDGDGNVEVMFGTTGACKTPFNKYSINVFKNNGEPMQGWPIELEDDETIVAQLTTSDVNGDKLPDILVPTTKGNIYAFDFRGNLLDGFPKRTSGKIQSSVVMGDIDGDLKSELIAYNMGGLLYVWDTESYDNSLSEDWPQFQHDAQHTGCYDCCECNSGECCDGCNFKQKTTTCRASTGACDKAETCTGTSSTCPTDLFQSNNFICRASTGACDKAETCTGTSSTCPTDLFQSNGAICRPQSWICDQAETCTGISTTCPGDKNITNCSPPIGAIFITSKTYNGNLGGATGADQKCQAEAVSAKLLGTWKAILSSSTTLSAKNRIPEAVYKTMNGSIIANNKADLFDGTIQNKIKYNQYGQSVSSSYVWTGSNKDGTLYTNYNCYGFTSSSSSVYMVSGAIGSSDYTSKEWIINFNNGACNVLRRLYCVKTA